MFFFLFRSLSLKFSNAHYSHDSLTFQSPVVFACWSPLVNPISFCALPRNGVPPFPSVSPSLLKTNSQLHRGWPISCPIGCLSPAPLGIIWWFISVCVLRDTAPVPLSHRFVQFVFGVVSLSLSLSQGERKGRARLGGGDFSIGREGERETAPYSDDDHLLPGQDCPPPARALLSR